MQILSNKRSFLEIILRSSKTVFTIADLVLLWKESDGNKISTRLNYYVKNKQLYKIKKGFYSKDKSYDKYELAIKLNPPSYISFETVLRGAGVTFQYYSQIFIASNRSGEKIIDGQKYGFKRLKSNILNSNVGIKKEGNVWVASTERALLDTIYLNKRYYFDSLRNVDWRIVDKILPIYNDNKRMAVTVEKLKKISYE